mgnify:CR=1 FL=1
MTRYEQVFSTLAATKKTAFIPFAVAGDPDLKTSEAIFKTYIDAGADILEIGYPFSDPIADGPVNQRAGMRAIAAGLNHDSFFALMARLRAYSDIPFGLLLYANTVHHLGYEEFCRRAAEAGIDSLLVADMPPEESREMTAAMRMHRLATVHIVTELTPEDRIDLICKQIDGFVYVVSRLGPTGANQQLSQSVASTLATVRRHTSLPLCVGFGLSTPDHVREIAAAGANGAIVGSALVRIIEEEHTRPEEMLRTLDSRVRAFKHAIA